MTNSRLYNPQTGMTPMMSYFLIGAGMVVVIFIIIITMIYRKISNRINKETDDVYKLVNKNKKETVNNITIIDRKLTESKKSLNEKLDEKTKKHDHHTSEKHIKDSDLQKKMNPLEKKINTLDTKQKVKENNMNAHLKSPHVSKSYVDDKLKILDDQFKTLDEQYKKLNTQVDSNSSSILHSNIEDSISGIRAEMTSHEENDKHLSKEQIDNLKSLNEFELRLAELEKTVDEISEEN